MVEARLLSPARGADEREPEVVAFEQLERCHEHVEVLARLEGGDAEDVLPAEVGAVAVGPEDRVDARIGDSHTPGVHAEQLDHVTRREV